MRVFEPNYQLLNFFDIGKKNKPQMLEKHFRYINGKCYIYLEKNKLVSINSFFI